MTGLIAYQEGSSGFLQAGDRPEALAQTNPAQFQPG